MMSDFPSLDEDIDCYVIGFTENHFIPADVNSPTPSEHTLGYNTFALDFAERSNRGELKNFLDHSFNLDRQKRQSVSKINHNILDLMFELSERRKVKTPLLSKSAMELHRSDSRFSNISDTSIKTSSSLPLIEVQQLPPLIQPHCSMPSLHNDAFGFPDLRGNSKDTGKIKKKSKKTSTNIKRDEEMNMIKKHGEVFNDLYETVKRRKDEKGKKSAKDDIKAKDIENKENDFRNVRFTIGEADAESEEGNDNGGNSDVRKSINKWKAIVQKLREANEMVKRKGDSFNAYRGRYYSITGDSPVRKMSYCQSSYKERAERERMNNIRRRHSSQTNVGPLDFNKLRRQITIGRSNTMLC